MKLQFDANQEYQRIAIEGVVRAFEGLPVSRVEQGMLVREDTVAADVIPNMPGEPSEPENPLSWYVDQLLENLVCVQQDNGLPQSALLDADSGTLLMGEETWWHPNYTVEMETGTGKTYVYLRSIYELRQRYGFSKFIIIVPSRAIYEGVVKNFDITRAHFAAIYGNETVNLTRYDGSQISRLRTFAASTACEVMVMTLDSFNKASNVIYKLTEKLPGELHPYEYIQLTRPILILDEPQNMESPKAKQAIRTLHPLFALRYSATHKSNPNILYRLTPFDAYRNGLVKRITVLGITERDNFNQARLDLDRVTTDGGLRAHVATYAQGPGGVKEVTVALRDGDDLYLKTKRAEHEGFVVEEISAIAGEAQTVRFTNGVVLTAGATDTSRPLIFREQIEQTIREHMKRQEELRPQGIKVLSLFFVDKVKSYNEDGIVRRLFDECFDRCKRRYPEWSDLAAEDVRRAYFAQKKTKNGIEEVDTADADDDAKRQEDRDAEQAAFQLIMRDKEQLLSFGEKASFIFAHSALKEGWDNPNVFQICTLKQTQSITRKRQEIGRGLRICVDQNGVRVPGGDVNVLLVVANESYKNYAEGLQKEYVEAGVEAAPPTADAARGKANRNPDVYRKPAFRELWRKANQKVDFSYNINSEELIEECIIRLNRRKFTKPVISIERAEFVQTRINAYLTKINSDGRAQVRLEMLDSRGEEEESRSFPVAIGDDLYKKLKKDERLKGFRVSEISGIDDDAFVKFGNGVVVTPHAPYTTATAGTNKPTERRMQEPSTRFPIPNLLERAARETGLTRPTINKIFKGMAPDQAEYLIHNPESFVNAFIAEVSNALADHITDRITFSPSGGAPPDVSDEELDRRFPETKVFSEKELVNGGKTSLYDQVQTDSDIERRFVGHLVDDTDLVFYFKFPADYKVALPRQIGNYNPDWGLGRLSDNGEITIQYIRETKGTEDITKLQYTHEKRKIRCAEKYFTALGIDYRQITDKTGDWYLPSVKQATLPGTKSGYQYKSS